MTIEELINHINAHRDPDPDSDWKYGKDYGIMVALSEIERYQKDNETHHGEQPEERTETHACDCISRKQAIDAMKIIEVLINLLDGTPLRDPCDKLFSPEGWCKEHCKTYDPTAECWLKYAEEVINGGTV